MNPGHDYCGFRPFERRGEVCIRTRHLPHWQQPGCTYFVTFRLADSLPRVKLEQWRRERNAFLQATSRVGSTDRAADWVDLCERRIERWLDSGAGSCYLRDPECARIVESALRHFDGIRHWLGSFVVMPNHVHVLLTPMAGYSVWKTVGSWKQTSARLINERLRRKGALWQDEPFDHIVRDARNLDRFRHYILENPAKAGLRVDEYLWGEGLGCRREGAD